MTVALPPGFEVEDQSPAPAKAVAPAHVIPAGFEPESPTPATAAAHVIPAGFEPELPTPQQVPPGFTFGGDQAMTSLTGTSPPAEPMGLGERFNRQAVNEVGRGVTGLIAQPIKSTLASLAGGLQGAVQGDRTDAEVVSDEADQAAILGEHPSASMTPLGVAGAVNDAANAVGTVAPVPEATTLGQKLTDVGVGTAGFIAKAALMKGAMGTPAGALDKVGQEAATWAMANPGGNPASESAKGAAVGVIDALPVHPAIKAAAQAVALGKMTQAEGGSGTDVGISMAIPAAMHAAHVLGGAKPAESGGAERSSSPPVTTPKTPAAPVSEAAKGGVENPSSPSPDPDQQAFRRFVQERDQQAFQQFVKERDQRDFDQWLASNKQGGSTDARPPEPAAAAKSPMEETPAAPPAPAPDAAPAGDTRGGVTSPAEPAPHPMPEQVQPVAGEEQNAKGEARQDAAGEPLEGSKQEAPPSPESVPDAAAAAHELPPGFEAEKPAVPHELPAGFEKEPEPPADVAEALAGDDAPGPAPAPAPEPPPRVGKLDALDAWAKSRLEKLGGVQLRGGAIPLDPIKDPQRLALLAIRGAVHITKGAAKFADWSKAMVADVTGLAEGHLPKVWQLARKIHAMGEDERAAWAQKQFAVEGTGESVKQSIRRLTGQSRPGEVRKQLADLAVKLKAEAAGAKEGFKLGAASERNRALTKEQSASETVPLAAAMKSRMVAEGKAHVAGAKEGYRAAVEDVAGVKKELVDVIQKNLPQEEHGQFLSAIAKARTPADVANVIDRVDRVVGEVDHRQARDEFRKTMKGLEVDKLSPALKEKAEALLSPIGLRDLRGNTTDKLRAMIEFAERNPDGPVPKETLEAARAALDKKRPEDMTAGEIRAIDTVVKNLKAQDRLIKEIKVGRKYRDARAAQDQAIATLGPRPSAEDAGPLRKLLYDPVAKDEQGNLLADPKKGAIGTFIERRLNPDALSLDFDAGKEGLFTHLLRDGLRDGADRAYKLFYQGQDHLAAATEGMGMKWGSRKLTDWSNERVTTSLERKTGRIVKDGDTGDVYGRKEETRTRELTMTRAQRLHLWGMLTDPETAPMLTRIKFKDRKYAWGFELSDADKQRFLASLTPEERAIGSAMKGYLGGDFMKAQNEVFRRILGYDKLTNPDYFPRRADRTEIAPEEPPTNVNNYSQKVLEDLGQYKDRVKHGLPFLVDNAFDVFRDVTFKGSSFTGQAEPLHAAWSVFGNPAVRQELVRIYGKQVIHQVDEHLAAATMLRGDEGSWTDKVISKLSNNAAKAILWKPKIAAKQLTGVVSLMADMGPGPVARALKKITRDPKLLSTTWDDIKAHSGILRDRYDGAANRMISAQYADERSAIGRQGLFEKLREDPSLLYKPHKLVGLGIEHGLDLMQAADYLNAVVAWHAARDMGLSGDEAGSRASLAISRTQNASSAVEYSGMQLEGRRNTFYRLASMFTSQNEATYNLLARKMIEFRHGPKDAAAVKSLARDVSLTAAAAVFGAKLVDDMWDDLFPRDVLKRMSAKQREQKRQQEAKRGVYRVIADMGAIGGGVPLSTGVKSIESAWDKGAVDTASLIPAPLRSFVDAINGASGVSGGVVRIVNDTPRHSAAERTNSERVWDGAETLAKGLGVMFGVPATAEATHLLRKGTYDEPRK